MPRNKKGPPEVHQMIINAGLSQNPEEAASHFSAVNGWDYTHQLIKLPGRTRPLTLEHAATARAIFDTLGGWHAMGRKISDRECLLIALKVGTPIREESQARAEAAVREIAVDLLRFLSMATALMNLAADYIRPRIETNSTTGSEEERQRVGQSRIRKTTTPLRYSDGSPQSAQAEMFVDLGEMAAEVSGVVSDDERRDHTPTYEALLSTMNMPAEGVTAMTGEEVSDTAENWDDQLSEYENPLALFETGLRHLQSADLRTMLPEVRRKLEDPDSVMEVIYEQFSGFLDEKDRYFARPEIVALIITALENANRDGPDQ